MFHGLYFLTPLTVRISPQPGFVCFVVCPDGPVENLECSLPGLGGYQWQSQNGVRIGEVSLARSDSQAITYPSSI